MSNKTILILLVVLISILFNIGCDSRDGVDRLFHQVIGRLPVDYSKPELQDVNRFKVYSLNQEQIEKLLNDDFKDVGFTGWRDGEYNITMGLKVTYSIKVNEDKIKVNSKKGSVRSNSVDIFLNLTTQKLILHNGLTYGI